MAKFGYSVNTIRIQRDVYFIFGNMQGKYNKRNTWIEVSDKIIPKPKISELNDFQSILMVSPHPPFLNEKG